MKQNYSLRRIALGSISFVAGNIFILVLGCMNSSFADPHTTIYKKNTPDAFSVREEMEWAASPSVRRFHTLIEFSPKERSLG